MFDGFGNFFSKLFDMSIIAGISLVMIILLCVYNYFFKSASGSFTLGSDDIWKYGKRIVKKHAPEYFDSDPNHTYDYIDQIDNYDDNFSPGSKLELKSKYILEEIFRLPFVKIRPEFLKNEVTGQNLEIDLYNDTLKLGVEYSGAQHYKFSPYFQKNKEAFYNQRYRDEMKKVKCKEYGITLIEIPYTVKERDLKDYIVHQLRIHGFLI